MVNTEDRYVSTAGVDHEEQGVILAQCDRPMRLERVVDATVPTSAGIELADI